MKTIREWLEELPEPYRTKAINNIQPDAPQYPKKQSLRSALIGAFVWEESPEGHKYWKDVYRGKYYEQPPKKTDRELAEEIMDVLLISDSKSMEEDINKIETILKENR